MPDRLKYVQNEAANSGSKQRAAVKQTGNSRLLHGGFWRNRTGREAVCASPSALLVDRGAGTNALLKSAKEKRRFCCEELENT